MHPITVLTLLSVLIPVVAHVPEFAGGNEDLESATVIENPAKSWAIYGELQDGGKVNYFRMNLKEGDRILLSLLVTTDPAEDGFAPSFAVMGPGFDHEDEDDHDHVLPHFVQYPDNYEIITVEGEREPEATYEGFTPSSFYTVGEISMHAPQAGVYYVAVFHGSLGGRYSLIVGYLESFSITEWVMVPVDVLSIYRWEGQALVVILTPMIATVSIGLLLLIRKSRKTRRRLNYLIWIMVLAGLTFIGSGISMFYQIIFNFTRVPVTGDAIITVLLAIFPILLGVGQIRNAFGSKDKIDRGTRAGSAVIGIMGFLVWAGIIVGPSLAIAASMLPQYRGTTNDSR
jgi:hypothetical protein